MSPSIKLLAAIVACCGGAGSAVAQCNLYRWNVPDFDQKRSALPGNGGMYCVPTSATNWMGYIANHGYAPIMSGPRTWQSQSNYDFVTSRDALMGSFMGTTASGGTGGSGGLSGLSLYMFAYAPFRFTASVWYGSITPQLMYFEMATNGLVDACYGYYDQTTSPFGTTYYARNGGHCVTLNGLVNVCSTSTSPTLRIRNPADDGTLTTQSAFATATTHGVMESFNSSLLPGFTNTLMRLTDFGVGSTTRRYLDTMYVIHSTFNCWAPATTVPEIYWTSAVSLFGDAQEAQRHFSLPTGSVANAIAVHPDQTKVVYVARSAAPGGPVYRMHLLNLADGTDLDFGLLLPAAPGKTPISFDRFGHLITCDGSVLKVSDVSGPAPVVLASRTLAAPASSVCFDDVLDEVVVLTPSNARLIRCPMDLSSAIDEPIPSGVPVTADGSVVPDPATGKYLVTVVGDGSVRELSLIAGSPRLMLSSSLLLPAVQSIQDIKPADGGGFYAMCDGSVRVLDRDPTSGLLRISPTPMFGGLPAMRCMSLSRSRTNYDASLHSGPAWVNLPNADEGVTPVVDCPADYNLSGSVTVQDIFDFLAGWFGGDPHADVNDSASITVQDIFDFLTAWFAGCP